MQASLFKAKVVIWCMALAPLIRLCWLAWQEMLTANPVEFIERSTGTWALVFLLLTLSITPLRTLTQQAWIMPLRRLLGLWMFAYACLHLLTYLWLDYRFVWGDIIKDITQHPYVLVGLAAFLLSIPLAATSNQAMIKRLKRRWKLLHQSIYLIAILAVLHFWWLVKKDVTEPIYYASVLFVLLLVRLKFTRRKKQVPAM